jgi:hypothetical protein
MADMISLDSVVCLSRYQASRELGDELVILDFKKGFYFGLNQVGARIWALLGEPTRVTEIRSRLLEEFAVDAEICEDDLLRLLEDLLARDLIEVVR